MPPPGKSRRLRGGELTESLWGSDYDPEVGTPFNNAGRLSSSYKEKAHSRLRLRDTGRGADEEAGIDPLGVAVAREDDTDREMDAEVALRHTRGLGEGEGGLHPTGDSGHREGALQPTEEVEGRKEVEQLFDVRTPSQQYQCDKAMQKGGCLAAVALARVHALQLNLLQVEAIDRCLWKILGRNILWSMKFEVLWSLVCGNVVELIIRPDPAIGPLFTDDSLWMQTSNGDAPVIYAVALVDKGGLAPTSLEMRQVIRKLRAYISTDSKNVATALAVDNIFRGRSSKEDIEAHRHHFLTKEKEGRRERVAGRVETVTAFCNGLEIRIAEELRSNGDAPMKRAHLYIGYTFRFAARRQHDAGTTNLLMHLVNGVLQVLFPGKYNLWAFPLCYLVEEQEVRCGEMLLTLLAGSFSSTGGGVNCHAPGTNNSSGDMSTWEKVKAEELWKCCSDFRTEMGFWEKSRKAEMPYLERYSSNGASESGPAESTQNATLGRLRDEKAAAEAKLATKLEDMRQSDRRRLKRVEEDLADWCPSVISELWEQI